MASHTIYRAIIIYLVLVNILTMMVFALDKWRARQSRWRIPENTLLGLVLGGGSLGGLAGMFLFRHKTRVSKFRWGIPAIMVIELFLGYYLCR